MRATALGRLRRYDDARPSLEKAMELDPDLRALSARLLLLRSAERLIELDYPVTPAVRWNAKPHPELAKIIAAGDARYAATIQSFGRYSQPLHAIRRTPSGAAAPHWINPWLPPMDSISVYGYLASRNPRRYVEIGSGMSTRFARRAIADHHLRTEIISIDPSPRSEIDARVIRSPLESADLSVFESLTSDDMVFCDNSHRAFQNSDATVFFLDVLPRVGHSCLIGVHDIFLPYDYPAEWLKRFYNEQYLLACWLLAGDRVHIELPIRHAATTPTLTKAFAGLLPEPLPLEGATFWFTLSKDARCR
jgi:hypothetical protein